VKAVEYEGGRKASLSDHPKPELKSPTGTLLSVTASSICESDLHIQDGRTAKPSKIVSHHIALDDAPEAYEKFDQRIEGSTKALIKFREKKKAASRLVLMEGRWPVIGLLAGGIL